MAGRIGRTRRHEVAEWKDWFSHAILIPSNLFKRSCLQSMTDKTGKESPEEQASSPQQPAQPLEDVLAENPVEVDVSGCLEITQCQQREEY